MHRDYARYHLRLARGCSDVQRKALALLRDIAAAGDDGVRTVDMVIGPQCDAPGGQVIDALSSLKEAGAIHHSPPCWYATYLGQLAAAHASRGTEAQP